MTLKSNWYHSCGCCEDSWSCGKLKRHVTEKYFEKKVRLWTLITFHYPSITGSACYYYNTWVTGVNMEYMLDRNYGGKTSQIEWLFQSNLRSFGYFKTSSELWGFFGPQLQRQLVYKSWLGASAPDCHLTPKIVHLQKTEEAFKS